MASKTVWMVGGLAIAIGAVAYLSYNESPAGKDAAGTIVEAKRAISDGSNSTNPTPTTSADDRSADRTADSSADKLDKTTGTVDKFDKTRVDKTTDMVDKFDKTRVDKTTGMVDKFDKTTGKVDKTTGMVDKFDKTTGQ